MGADTCCSEALVVGRGRRRGGTLRRLKIAFSSLAKHLQFGTRRQRLTEQENTPCHTPATPQHRCRQILGRTPTKLYSPFGIETPRYIQDADDNAYYPSTPEHGYIMDQCSPVPKHYKSKSHVWRLLNTRPRSLFH